MSAAPESQPSGKPGNRVRYGRVQDVTDARALEGFSEIHDVTSLEKALVDHFEQNLKQNPHLDQHVQDIIADKHHNDPSTNHTNTSVEDHLNNWKNLASEHPHQAHPTPEGLLPNFKAEFQATKHELHSSLMEKARAAAKKLAHEATSQTYSRNIDTKDAKGKPAQRTVNSTIFHPDLNEHKQSLILGFGEMGGLPLTSAEEEIAAGSKRDLSASATQKLTKTSTIDASLAAIENEPAKEFKGIIDASMKELGELDQRSRALRAAEEARAQAEKNKGKFTYKISNMRETWKSSSKEDKSGAMLSFGVAGFFALVAFDHASHISSVKPHVNEQTGKVEYQNHTNWNQATWAAFNGLIAAYMTFSGINKLGKGGQSGGMEI